MADYAQAKKNIFRYQGPGDPQGVPHLYTTLRDKSHDLWVWVAFDPQTKLIPGLQLGPRTQDLAHALVHAVTLTLAPGCVPACTSDGLNLYFYALTAHFGHWLTDPATGKALPFSGAVFQKQNAAYGFLLGTNQSSRVSLTP